jgi:protein required for attachment to host cells
LILIADGQKYLFLRNLGNFTEPVLTVETKGQHVSQSTHEQGSDQPGRAFATSGPRRNAMEQTDFHQLEMDRFAKQAAAILQDRADKNDFEELIVVAPSHTLAELRKHYGKAVTARLVAEVDKDLTKHTVDQITKILTR